MYKFLANVKRGNEEAKNDVFVSNRLKRALCRVERSATKCLSELVSVNSMLSMIRCLLMFVFDIKSTKRKYVTYNLIEGSKYNKGSKCDFINKPFSTVVEQGEARV